jgi:hypothetical protein
VGNAAVLFSVITIALVCIVLVFWQKANSAKAEKARWERRAGELTAELAGVRGELAQAQAESATRAGFESLAAEREKTIGQLTAEREKSISQLAAERDGLRADLQAKTEAEERAAGFGRKTGSAGDGQAGSGRSVRSTGRQYS